MRAALFALGTVAIAGCALVIDLGEPAKLRPVDAGTAADTSPPPVDAAVEAGPSFLCGLPDSTNAACAKCQQGSCCDVNKACAADPDCAAGLECIKDCVVNSACIEECQKDRPLLRAVTNCTINNCVGCTPPAACVKLGGCIYNLPRTSIVRRTYSAVILELDSQRCTDSRMQIVENEESDAGACY